MGNYEQLKQSVSDVIKANGNQEITGSILQNVLLTIISTVGANATFAGVATPATNPGTPDGSVFWLASKNGTYSNFGGITLTDEVAIFNNINGSWVKLDTEIASSTKIAELEEDKFIINTTIGVCNFDSPTWFTDLRYQANRCISKGYKACNISLLIPDGYLAAPMYGDKNVPATRGDYKSDILEISSDMLYFRIVVKKTDNSDLSEAIILRISNNIAKINTINAKISTIEDDIKGNEDYLNEINKSYVHKSIPLFGNVGFNWDKNDWFTQKLENKLRASTKGFEYIHDSLLVSPDNIAISIINGNKDEALSNINVDYTGKCTLLTKGNAYPFFRIVARKLDDSEVTYDDLFNGIEVIPLEEYICKKKIYWTQGGYDYKTFRPLINAQNLASSTPIIGNCMIKLKDGYKVYHVFECDGFTITRRITDFTSYNNANNIVYTGGKNIIISVGDINRSEEVPLDGSVIEEIVYLEDAQKTYSLYNKPKDMMSIISDGWALDENGYLKNNGLPNKLILDREYAINPRKFIFNFILENGIAYFGAYPSKYRLQPRVRALFSIDLNLGKFSVYKIFQDNSGNVDDITDVYKQVDIPNFETYSNKDMQIELYHNFDNDYYANLIDGVTGEILCSLTGLANTTVGFMFERPYCYSLNNLMIKNITINTSPIPNCVLMIFGDSITEGIGATDFSKSYAGLISNDIGNNIVRISGRSSGIIDNVIERIKAEAVYIKPKYIMVTIGANGGNTENKLKELIELIKSINAIPIINHIPMLKDYNSVIERNNMIDNVLNWYKENGETIRCAKYDIVTAINNIPSQGQNGELFSDGVHPNNVGHNLMYLRTKIDIPELF